MLCCINTVLTRILIKGWDIMKHFYIISRAGSGEIVEKKSRFIANVYPVKSEEEDSLYIEKAREKYWDARHNCYAMVIGAHDEVQRCSDDGEPSGTAGKPILEVIHGRQLHNCLIIVTRYFGGVLLGTGGLVRAYTSAAIEGLSDAGIKEQLTGSKISLTFDYSNLAKIQHISTQLGLELEEVSYTDRITASVMAVPDTAAEFIAQVTDNTSGQAELNVEDGVLIYRDADAGEILHM